MRDVYRHNEHQDADFIAVPISSSKDWYKGFVPATLQIYKQYKSKALKSIKHYLINDTDVCKVDSIVINK